VGNHNVGDYNRGNHNVGNHNVGDYNRGNHNVGNHNVGDYNRGNHNVGNHNVGNHNVGDYNVGNHNQGNNNTGDRNVGNGNVGNGNVGNDNVGDNNVGDRNFGNGNRGDDNIGDNNVGDRNIGNDNRGNDNQGNANVGNGNIGNGLQGNNQRQGWSASPYSTVAGVGVDLGNNYYRGIGTYNDAATRHDRAAARASTPEAAARHRRLADYYRSASDQLRDITQRRAPRGVHGHIPERVQQWSARTAADGINRVNTPDGRVMGNSRVSETVRRGLTKVTGASTIIGVGIDVASGISRGEAPAYAVGRAGSTAIVGAAAGAGAQAAIVAAGAAAAVPVAGWAVAGGIVVGVGVSMVFANTNIDNKIGEAAEGAWNGAKSAGRAVGDFVGGLF
jgi:hypothetical protein